MADTTVSAVVHRGAPLLGLRRAGHPGSNGGPLAGLAGFREALKPWAPSSLVVNTAGACGVLSRPWAMTPGPATCSPQRTETRTGTRWVTWCCSAAPAGGTCACSIHPARTWRPAARGGGRRKARNVLRARVCGCAVDGGLPARGRGKPYWAPFHTVAAAGPNRSAVDVW